MRASQLDPARKERATTWRNRTNAAHSAAELLEWVILTPPIVGMASSVTVSIGDATQGIKRWTLRLSLAPSWTPKNRLRWELRPCLLPHQKFQNFMLTTYHQRHMGNICFSIATTVLPWIRFWGPENNATSSSFLSVPSSHGLTSQGAVSYSKKVQKPGAEKRKEKNAKTERKWRKLNEPPKVTLHVLISGLKCRWIKRVSKYHKGDKKKKNWVGSIFEHKQEQ